MIWTFTKQELYELVKIQKQIQKTHHFTQVSQINPKLKKKKI